MQEVTRQFRGVEMRFWEELTKERGEHQQQLNLLAASGEGRRTTCAAKPQERPLISGRSWQTLISARLPPKDLRNQNDNN